jgi:hypothetical protein
MVCDLTVVRDEDMHACSGDVLHVGGRNGAFGDGETMILPVSLPPQLWNLHKIVAPPFLFKSGSRWYLHQGTQTCITCWDFLSTPLIHHMIGAACRVQTCSAVSLSLSPEGQTRSQAVD